MGHSLQTINFRGVSFIFPVTLSPLPPLPFLPACPLLPASSILFPAETPVQQRQKVGVQLTPGAEEDLLSSLPSAAPPVYQPPNFSKGGGQIHLKANTLCLRPAALRGRGLHPGLHGKMVSQHATTWLGGEALGANSVFTKQSSLGSGEPPNPVGSASKCPCKEVTGELPPSQVTPMYHPKQEGELPKALPLHQEYRYPCKKSLVLTHQSHSDGSKECP